MASEPKDFASRDEPLGGVKLIPPNGVAIVHGELVVEIVISFTHCNDGCDEVIPRSQPVVEGG